jgi:rare lipoprotein A
LKILLAILIVFSTSAYSQKAAKKGQNGRASFYHDKFQGRKTSSGEMYEKHDFTAAHRTLPFNSLVLVTNKINNRSVVVRINDRGPFHKSRMIDLSKSAAMKAGMIPFGVVPVKITPLRLLENLPVTDSSLNTGEIWNCKGKLTLLKGSSISLWETDHWQHAVYMASDLELDYVKYNFVVRVLEINGNRRYELIMTGIEDEISATRQLQQFKEQGFIDAIILP